MSERISRYIGIRRTGGKLYYQFNLECSCGYFSELGVPEQNRKLISCPDCGALFFMTRPSGMFAQPRLISVLSTRMGNA